MKLFIFKANIASLGYVVKVLYRTLSGSQNKRDFRKYKKSLRSILILGNLRRFKLLLNIKSYLDYQII